MKLYKDAEGREWPVKITYSTVERVKDLTGIDLTDLKDGELFKMLASDMRRFADVLFACVRPDADAKGIDLSSFLDGHDGDTFDAATQAFLEELTKFYPPLQRRVLEGALGKMREVEGMIGAAVAEQLNNEEITEKLKATLRTSIALSGNSPESSG